MLSIFWQVTDFIEASPSQASFIQHFDYTVKNSTLTIPAIFW